MRIVRYAPAVAAVLATLALGPARGAAQVEEMPLDRERITQYARAHMDLNAARDEFHGKVGRIHDQQGRDRARQELEGQIADILESHGLTREEYDYLTLAISIDGEARALFDAVMVELAEEGRAPARSD